MGRPFSDAGRHAGGADTARVARTDVNESVGLTERDGSSASSKLLARSSPPDVGGCEETITTRGRAVLAPIRTGIDFVIARVFHRNRILCRLCPHGNAAVINQAKDAR